MFLSWKRAWIPGTCSRCWFDLLCADRSAHCHCPRARRGDRRSSAVVAESPAVVAATDPTKKARLAPAPTRGQSLLRELAVPVIEHVQHLEVLAAPL